MKISIATTTLLCALVALSTSFLGCETEPSEQIALQISPNMVTLRVGESQEFVASGFKDYTWEIVEDSVAKPGVLSTKKGDRTVFTAGPGGPGSAGSSNGTSDGYWEPLVVTLRVSGIPLTATSSGTTDTTPQDPAETTYLAYAEALITIRPDDEVPYPPASPRPDPEWGSNPDQNDTPEPINTTISISPSVVTIKNGQSVELKAVGDESITGYAWSLEGTPNGYLSTLAGPSTVFIATNAPATTSETPFTQIISLSANGANNTPTAAITITSYP